MIDNGMYDMEVKDGGPAVVNAYANATKGDKQNENPQDDESCRDSADDMDLGIADTEDMTKSDWDPFKSLKAPFGYLYDSKLAFFCFGPTTQHFLKVLRLGGSKFDDPKTKKKGSRAAMRKEEEKRNAIDCVVGIERGLSQQSQITFGLMAQNEESAAQAHRDMRMTGIMKRIETNTQLVKICMLLWKELDEGEVKDKMFKYISDLLEK